ncbi:MAG: DMT family transporter [Nitrospirota bacterium]
MFDLRLLFVSLVWGVNFAFVKFALADFLPLSFTVTRFILAALFLFCVMIATKEPLGLDRKDRLAVIKLGFIGITLYNIFFMYGLKHTSASHSALFISLSPLFAVLLQAVSGRERLGMNVIAGVALAMAGVYLVISSHGAVLASTPSSVSGDLLTLAASFLWALYTTSSKTLLERYSPVKITAYCMAAGSVMLVPIGAHELLVQQWTAVSIKSWSAFTFSAIVSGGIAFSLWYHGVKRIGVTRTIAYHYLVPFVAVAFAALFLGERITLLQMSGGAAIIGGVALVQRRKAEGERVGG